MEKQKEKDETHKGITEKPKHKQAREIVFLSLPHSTQKIQADFLSKLLHFSRLPPLFLSKPPYPAHPPFTLRAGHAPTRIYALAHSANLPFLPSPFTSPHNKLYINRLRVKATLSFTFTFTATT